jgi:helix-turn-helix protein
VASRAESGELIARFARENYTPKEVAALFRVDVATVARWRRAGKITGIELPGGRRWMYPRHLIDALLVTVVDPRVVLVCQQCGTAVETEDGRMRPHRRQARQPGRPRLTVICDGTVASPAVTSRRALS